MSAKDEAVHLAQYYFRLIFQKDGVRWDEDNDSEIALIVDRIVDAARDEVREEIKALREEVEALAGAFDLHGTISH